MYEITTDFHSMLSPCEINGFNSNFVEYEIINYLISLGITTEQIRIINRNEIEIDLSIKNNYEEYMHRIDTGTAIFKSQSYYASHDKVNRLIYPSKPLYTIHRLVADALCCTNLLITNLEKFPRSIISHTKRIDIDLSYNQKLVDISNFPLLDVSAQHSIYLTSCTMLKNLSGLPKDFIGSLHLHDTIVENFDNIPRGVTGLQISSTNISSLDNVDTFSELITLKADNLVSYESITTVLLCKKLKSASFINDRASIIYYDSRLLTRIMNDFISIPNKSEYVMDCSLRLIDNGFEKYV